MSDSNDNIRYKLLKVSRSARANSGGAGAVIQIGDQIPSGKRRCIWKIVITPASGAGAEDLITLGSCVAAGGVQTNSHGVFAVGDLAASAGKSAEYGGDVLAPVVIIQESATSQDINILETTAAQDVLICYYDLPI